MNESERDEEPGEEGEGENETGGAVEERRKVNIAHDRIRRNYCCIKIYRILEARLGKFTSSCACRLWVSNMHCCNIAKKRENPRSRDTDSHVNEQLRVFFNPFFDIRTR